MDDVIDLRDYARVLRRRWLLIAVVTVLTTAAGLGWAFLQTPVYEGEAELVVEPVRRSQDVSLDELLQREETVETERRVMTSLPVRERVAEANGIAAEDLEEVLTTAVVPNSRVVRIRVTDTDATLAAALANGVADAYLTFRRDTALATLVDAQDTIDERITEVRARIDELDGLIDEARTDDDTALEAERGSLVTTLGSLIARQGEFGDAADVMGGGTVISPAEPARSPVSPTPVRTGILAMALGLALGVGAALLRDQFDDVVRTEEDVDRATGGRPVVGRIPLWRQTDEDQALVTLTDPQGPTAEAYTTLATNLKYLALDEDDPDEQLGRIIVVTSAGPGDGKTSTAANLAVAAARAGRVTMLIDCDLRRPTVARRFRLPNGRGLTDALGPSVDAGEVAQQVGGPRLRVLTSGPIPPNPSDVLSSRAMRYLLDQARRDVDLVVLDSPPVMAVADAIELAHAADALVMVVKAGHTHRRAVTTAVETMRSTGLHLAGVVVNGIGRSDDGYGYGYGYEYERDQDADVRSLPGHDHHRRSVRAPDDRPLPPPPAAPTDEGALRDPGSAARAHDAPLVPPTPTRTSG